VFQQLVSRNDDLRRLVEKGYAVAFEPGYLIVRDIPYLDDGKQLQIGALVAKLVFVDAERIVQDDHQVYFAGSVPHNMDGTPVTNLGGGAATIPLGEASNDVIVQRSFSNKPRDTGKFEDFFHKIESYVAIISGPAMALHPVSPYTFRTVQAIPGSVFKFHDTMTSRAEIGDLSAKFKDDVVAVIGLGGTGAYLLDFLVKTPVREVRAFDHDSFHVHTGFRSPGKLDVEDLGRPKADVYQARYDNFRHGLSITRRAIDLTSGDELDGVTFAFVCVDKGTSRATVFNLILSKRIPFIDVGMGLSRRNGPLNGMLRMTYYSAENGERVRAKGYAELADSPDDLYRANIQISELNALNASLAIIKFKQLRGFYFEEESHHQLLLEIGDCKVVGASELK
jgi:ThiF family